MGKVFKAVAKIALVVGGYIVAGPIGAAAGAAIGNVLMPIKAPRVPLSQIERLNASINPTAFRCGILGETALNTDIRYGYPSGTEQRYIDYIIGVACHRVESIDEIWIENRKAWSAAGGYEAWTIVGGVNRLTVTVRTEGSAGNAINIGGSWNGTARLTGCAYVRLRIDRQGTKKTDSPFSNGLASRVTIKGKGWPLYDPRLDSTRGGSGAHRADNQATWGTTTGRNNLPLQILNYLIGWRIGGKLSVGCGALLEDLDFGSFITAANTAAEAIAKAGGGTQPRYEGAGVFNEGEDREQILQAMLDACNGELRDNNGKIALHIRTNDLAAPVAAFSEKNILGTVRRSSGNTTETPTVVRGRYTDPSDTALYTLADVPEVLLPGTHPVETVLPLDLSWVQNAAQAQRIYKQVLQRAQYPDTFEADYDLTALKAEYGDIVEQDFAPLGWAGAKFRVLRQVLNMNGRIAMTLGMEHASIYAWDAEESAAVTAAAPTTFDPLNAGAILAAAEATAAADAAQATNSANLYRVESAGVTSSIALSGAGISEVRFGNANGLDLTPAASNVVNIVLSEVGLVPGDVISVAALLAYSDAGGDDARLRVRFKDAAGAEVGLTTGNPQSTPLAETRFELPNLTIPAGTAAITVGSRLTGGTGTATVRNVMVNRGPICAPYVPPVRGADVTATSAVGINFNARNDRNAAAVTAPTIATDGTAVDHTIATDGSSDISFEWSWGGTEADIDGFIVYVYRSASASAYTFGTTPAEEREFHVAPDRRALLLYGVPADPYYTFGVRAYRIVDPDVNAAGRILSTLVKATGSGENPYRPSASVAFAGNVSGTVGGSAASTVAAGALAANAGVNSDGTIKDDKVTTGAIAADALSGLPNAIGSGTFTTSFQTRATYTFTADAEEKYLVLISGIVIIGDLAAAGTYADVQLEKNGSTAGALIAQPVSRIKAAEQMFCFPVEMSGLSGSQTLDLRFRASATHGAGDPHLVERAGIHIIRLKR